MAILVPETRGEVRLPIDDAGHLVIEYDQTSGQYSCYLVTQNRGNVRYLGEDVDDAPRLAEQMEL